MLESSSSSSHCSFRGETMNKGEDNGIRTVECLRGRLLAERMASKAAKEEADMMAKRLGKLEKQMAEEIKSRNRAEKKLKYALKKLKSLKIMSLQETLEGSLESWKTDWKTDSMTVDSFGQCGLAEQVDDVLREMGVNDVGGDDTLACFSANQMVSQQGSCSSVSTAHSWSKEVPNADEESSEKDYDELSTAGGRQTSTNTDDECNLVQEAEQSDDTLAFVPAKNSPFSSSACNSDVSTAGEQDVLVTLKQVKKLLRNSMQGRGAAESHPQPLYGR